MRAIFIILLSAAFLISCSSTKASGPWKDNFGQERSAEIPNDVRDFVIKAQACGHFSGEPAYDGERRKFLEKMVAETCTGLEEKRPKLLAKYDGNAQVADLIKEVWVFD